MDKFSVGEVEVYFVQDKPVTVCLIRNNLDILATGITFQNPHDKWDASVGRHKAFKKALDNYCDYSTTYSFPVIGIDGTSIIRRTYFTEQRIKYTILGGEIPVYARQEFNRAYWNHFREIEKW